MTWSLLLAAIVLLSAAGVPAQPEEEKPKIEFPELTHRQPSGQSGTFTITVVEYQLANKGRDIFPQAIPALIAFFRQYIQIDVAIRWNALFLDNARLDQASLLYMTGNDATLRLGDQEKKNLGNYLANGGLLFGDDIRYPAASAGLSGQQAGIPGTPFDRQFKALIADPLVLGSRGQRWVKVPNDHPLYWSYFDFPDGPPLSGAPGGEVRYLEMLEVRGRPAVLFSDLNLSWFWGDPLAEGRLRGLQFGGNLIVYAMTRQVVNWR
jgi:hypothetical protein